MSSISRLIEVQNMTVAEVLARLITRDDAPIMIKMLSVLRALMTNPASDFNTEANITDVPKTIESLMNANGHLDGQVTQDSIVLVAASRHGSPHIVECVLTNTDATIYPMYIEQAKIAAEENKHVVIVERLTVAGVVDGNEKPQLSQHGEKLVPVLLPKSVDHTGANASPETAVQTYATPNMNPNVDFDQQRYEEAMEQASIQEDDETIELLSLVNPRDCVSAQGITALWFACYNGETNTAKYLLTDCHINPAATHNAAIQLASMAGHIDICKMLLSDPRICPEASEDFALRLASENGHTEIVRLLVSDLRVDPSASDNSPIGVACQNGHTQTAALLLSNPRVNPTADDNYALRSASEYGHLETVQLLLSDTRVDPSVGAAITEASANGHTDIVKLLLSDSRVNPAVKNDESICLASRNGHTDIVRLLLAQPRVNPAASVQFPMRFACQNGHTQVVKLLLSDLRVDPSEEENFAIRKASQHGHLDIVKLLLSDPRVSPAGDQNFAIVEACCNGHTDVVKLLLADHRVDPAAVRNETCLKASANGHPETLGVILDDPRVQLSLNQHRCLVRLAIDNGFVDVIALLLAHRPLARATHSEFFDLCAKLNRGEVFRILLRNVNLQELAPKFSIRVETSLRLAHTYGSHQFVLELLSYSSEEPIAKVVDCALQRDVVFLARLACMHVDVLRVLVTKYRSHFEDKAKNILMSSACASGNGDVVRELLDNHQDTKVKGWDTNDFNVAALHGFAPVLRLLSLARYGGCKKLTENPPLNRICARKVLDEMHMTSSMVLMWCVKKKTTAKVMARVLDVLRDMITYNIFRYEME